MIRAVTHPEHPGRRRLFLCAAAVLFAASFPACRPVEAPVVPLAGETDAPPPPEPAAPPPAEPDEAAVVPQPLQVEYKAIRLGEDDILYWRDDYGVPHVEAPSIEAAFRAQAYVLMEDRFRQTLKSRDGARGRRARTAGAEAIHFDREVRLNGYTDDELRAQADGLSAIRRGYIDAYIAGINDYIAANAPDTEPWTVEDCVAQAVYMVSIFGEGGDEEYDILNIFDHVKSVRGETFAWTMLDDSMPANVSNAPTTDHSTDGVLVRQPALTPVRVDMKTKSLASALGLRDEARRFAEADGLFTKWGSNAWVISPQRSATGKAMIFGGPMMGWHSPSIAAEVHLKAPGLDVVGLCFPGLPGIQIGHNRRLAWTTTSGGMNQTDFYALDLHPANPYLYRNRGEWRMMDMHDMPIEFVTDDGRVMTQPFTQYRSVYGPVVAFDEENNRAFSRCAAHRGQELNAWMSFIDMNMAEDFAAFEAAVRAIPTSHNFFAADIDGNIGYWLAGRLPILPAGADPRLPKRSDGTEDWLGVQNATDLVRSINPHQGWFGNWNNKPGVAVESWMPEIFWGIQVLDTLGRSDSMTFDDVLALNRKAGEHAYVAYYFKPFLIDVLYQHLDEDPRIEQAIALLESWDDANVPGEPAALIMEEWFMELMVETLSPAMSGVMIRRSMDFNTLRIFGVLTFRALFPEHAGVALGNDYLRGRTRDDIAYRAFTLILDRLTQRYGEDLTRWSYDPGAVYFSDVGSVPMRKTGSFNFAAELTNPIRAVSVLPPGQSEHPYSPHFDDQFHLFEQWEYKPLPAQPPA